MIWIGLIKPNSDASSFSLLNLMCHVVVTCDALELEVYILRNTFTSILVESNVFIFVNLPDKYSKCRFK